MVKVMFDWFCEWLLCKLGLHEWWYSAQTEEDFLKGEPETRYTVCCDKKQYRDKGDDFKWHDY